MTRPIFRLLTLACLALMPGAFACAPKSPAAPRPGPSAATVPRTAPADAVALSAVETRLRESVRTHYESYITVLQRAVDIPSGSLNISGVRKVGELFAGELQALGFETRLEDSAETARRGPHLIATHRGTRGPRLLLIGHLDTVFEGEGQGWTRTDTIARGAGTNDMKGGNVAMLMALRALADAGLLKDMQITVVMTGDEESTGHPVDVARKPLIDAARQSDLALGFEGGSATRVALGRRGASSWRLIVNGRQAHSSGIFSQGTGFGAVYEGVRILDSFRREIPREKGLTYNVGLVGGGAHVLLDSANYSLSADGKSNIIPPMFVAQGDLRFMTEGQKDSARARMREIVARPLPGGEGVITFADAYPAMPVTAQGERLLALFSATSQSLGYPAVGTTAPEDRGAGDISFVAPIIPGIDGLGVAGGGSHTPRESINLRSLLMSGERAAVFMARLVESWGTIQ